jgi:hypothetical protein
MIPTIISDKVKAKAKAKTRYHAKKMQLKLKVTDAELEKIYAEYLKNYERVYSKEEYAMRFKIFKRNYFWMLKMNQKGLSYKLGLTRKSDYSSEKNKRSAGLKPDQQSLMALLQSGKATVMTHTKKFLSRMKQTTSWAPVNWTSLYLEPRAQSTCGGCWAFSSASLVEAWIAQKFGRKEYLSVQNLISCDTNDNACDGGWYANSLAYLQTAGMALDTEVTY